MLSLPSVRLAYTLDKGFLFIECQFVALGTEASVGPTEAFLVECQASKHSTKTHPLSNFSEYT